MHPVVICVSLRDDMLLLFPINDSEISTGSFFYILTGADSLAKNEENVRFYKILCVLVKWLDTLSSYSCCTGIIKSVCVCSNLVITFFFLIYGDFSNFFDAETFLFFCNFLLSFNSTINESLKLSSRNISFRVVSKL